MDLVVSVPKSSPVIGSGRVKGGATELLKISNHFKSSGWFFFFFSFLRVVADA